jgi:hypothetical protein
LTNTRNEMIIKKLDFIDCFVPRNDNSWNVSHSGTGSFACRVEALIWETQTSTSHLLKMTDCFNFSPNSGFLAQLDRAVPS